MIKFNLAEFKRYCDNKNPDIIIYNSDNNNSIDSDPLKMCLVFDKIQYIGLNPNVLCLKGESGVIFFVSVIEIDVNSNGSILGDIVYVKCKTNGHTAVYTLIFQ